MVKNGFRKVQNPTLPFPATSKLINMASLKMLFFTPPPQKKKTFTEHAESQNEVGMLFGSFRNVVLKFLECCFEVLVMLV